jgi:alanyl-tRNA synthetase
MTPEDARNMGARALFGEKYGEEVRVVSMGLRHGSNLGAKNDTFSLELCGGTHVKKTGDIGTFKILSQTASAGGIRRIEALTGEAALSHISEQEKILHNINDLLKSKSLDTIERLINVLTERKQFQNELLELRKKFAVSSKGKKTSEGTYEIKGVKLIFKVLVNVPTKDLRGIVDIQKDKIERGIIIVISELDQKLSIISGITDNLLDKISSVEIVQIISEITGGNGGGGRPDMAQAGGIDKAKIPKALNSAKKYIEDKL